MDLIISVAHERDHLSVREPGAGDIFRIYQQHVAGALNASQAVAQSVNRRVELVVAAHRKKAVASRRILESCRGQSRGRRELGVAALGLLDPFSGGIAPVESSRRKHARVEVMKS